MPINLFDCFLAAFLIAGIIRGRKHGLSEELLRVLKWLTLVCGCALVYRPLGSLMSSAGFLDSWAAFVSAYLGAALVILLVFSSLQKRIGSKLVGTDAFGRAEYYLGMGSGLLRYACILMVGLALLNSRNFTPAELKAEEKYQVDAYGSTVFPTLRNLQEMVFEDSFTGACIKNNFGFLLIQSADGEPAAPPPAQVRQPTPGKHLSQARR
ncbi:MAG TPA: CvpA family protein [Verrucomicrobiae bacterium]